jgi:threonine dehydrogenase-like Zn-dependent dehydrogenase
VIAIDRFPERLRMAREQGCEIIDYELEDVLDTLNEKTGGRGPDACIEAVGMESHSAGFIGAYDKLKQTLMLSTERPHPLRQAIMACRNGGIVSIPGVYGGFADKLPIGSVMNRSITIKTGQTHVHRYLQPLLQKIVDGEIDPSFVITHRMSLSEAPQAFAKFRNKEDGCIKVVLKPNGVH